MNTNEVTIVINPSLEKLWSITIDNRLAHEFPRNTPQYWLAKQNALAQRAAEFALLDMDGITDHDTFLTIWKPYVDSSLNDIRAELR